MFPPSSRGGGGDISHVTVEIKYEKVKETEKRKNIYENGQVYLKDAIIVAKKLYEEFYKIGISWKGEKCRFLDLTEGYR
jgi:phage-related protein